MVPTMLPASDFGLFDIGNLTFSSLEKMSDPTAKEKVSVTEDGAVKKSPPRHAFPGQIHFPEISPRLALPTIIVLFAAAIAVAVVVWWLKG
jgi:hypothetical protein